MIPHMANLSFVHLEKMGFCQFIGEGVGVVDFGARGKAVIAPPPLPKMKHYSDRPDALNEILTIQQ